MKLWKSCIMREDCISGTHGPKVVWNHLTCWKINSCNGTPRRWQQRAPKQVRALVQQCDLGYERQCIKCWFNEGKINMKNTVLACETILRDRNSRFLWNACTSQPDYNPHNTYLNSLSQSHELYCEPDTSNHTFTASLFNICFNIILPPMPTHPKWSLTLRFSNQNLVCLSHFSHTNYKPHSSLMKFILLYIPRFSLQM